MSFAKNICKNIGKNIGKEFSGKYRQILLGHVKHSVTETAIQKIAETTGDLIGNKITDRITKVSKTS